MSNLASVCVYCGSASQADASYKEVARAVGQLLAQKKIRLVYGGGHVGLMGTIADAALEAGGEVYGIIPDYLHDREKQHAGLTRLFIVDNMHARKSKMAKYSDGFIILPGGFGTLDEMFEILTWKQLGMHSKPVIIYNANNFWDPLLKLIEKIIGNGFALPDTYKLFKVVNSLEELAAVLDAPPEETYDPSAKWA